MSESKNLIKLWGNDKKRKAFLESYSEWGVWFETPQLKLKWYRYQLPNNTTIIALEYRQETFSGYPSRYEVTTGTQFYTQTEGKPFGPGCHKSISAIVELLKAAKSELIAKSKGQSNENSAAGGART